MRSTTLTKMVAGTLAGAAMFATLPATALAQNTAEPLPPVEADLPAQLVLLSESGPVVEAGDTVWVALKWTAVDGPISDVRVTAGNRKLGVAYPENTGKYAAPWNGPNLFEGETDYTAFRIDVPEEAKALKMNIRATYVAEGKRQSSKFTIKLPVQNYDGDDLVLENPEVTLPEGAGVVELKFTGVAPALRRFQVMIPNPDKAYLEYPQGDFASLDRDDRLSRGETDAARFYIDMSYLGAGQHKLELSAIYRKNGKAVTTPFTLVVNIP
jgi:hypothetical protein